MSLLPNEWIENSIEVYNYQHTTKSQAIYWVVLAPPPSSPSPLSI